MNRRRFLTETATPEEVASANDLIAEIRRLWHLVCAWEHWDPATLGGSFFFSKDNPYAAAYEDAVEKYEAHRDR